MTEHPDTITVAKCHPFRGDNFYITLPGSARSGIEYIRADVARAERDAAVAQALTVKPLEWDDFSHDSFSAQSPFGEYVVELHEQWGMWTPDEGELAPEAHSYYVSPSEAKAAAQADYEFLILSALIPAPAGKETPAQGVRHEEEK